MTIRKQLNLFIAAIIILPLLSVFSAFAISNFSSAKRVFDKGSRRLKYMDGLLLSDTDWKIIREAITTVPKEKQACLIAQNIVVASTFPEIHEWTRITEKQLWIFIKETSGEYFYQFETPPLGTQEQRVFLVSRIDKDRHIRIRQIFRVLLCLVTTFIIFILVIILAISRSLFESLSLLENQTQKIADGELDIKIEIDGKKKNEITSMSESLERMRHSLKDAQHRKSMLVMGISHDLRTPIAVIKGYSEAMSDGMLDTPDQKQKAMDIIIEKMNQLESMVDTLIDYEKLSADEWKRNMENVELKHILTILAKNYATTGTVFKREVIFSIDIPEDTRTMMNVQQVQRAFDNLFSNALRYTKDEDSISITATHKEKFVTLKISDSGCGIEQEEIKNIFDLFYRGTTSRQEEGMGIGLSVVKNIIDIHGWEIDVKSNVGEGTEFILTIPVE